MRSVIQNGRFFTGKGKEKMKNQTCVVIGGAGFLGSHLVDYLVAEGNEVIVLDNLICGRTSFINHKARFIWCDITHSEFSLIKLFKKLKVDYVFNYAAEPYVPSSYDRPLHTLDINARGALMVINAATEAYAKGILQVSSAEIYGDVQGLISEDDPAHPRSTYGATKLCIDMLVQARFRESGCPVVSLRQFNCLGERDVLHPYVLPAIYQQLSEGDTVRLGNNSFRDFIYAGDAVRIAVELVEKGRPGEVYNLGSQEGIKMYDLARMVGELLGHKKIEVIEDDSRKRAWEIWHLQSDNTKINSVVDARPEVSLPEAVARTVHYYNENPNTWAF